MWNCKQIQRRCHWQLACSMSSLWQFSIERRGGTIVDHDHAKKSSHCHHPSVALQKKSQRRKARTNAATDHYEFWAVAFVDVQCFSSVQQETMLMSESEQLAAVAVLTSQVCRMSSMAADRPAAAPSSPPAERCHLNDAASSHSVDDVWAMNCWTLSSAAADEDGLSDQVRLYLAQLNISRHELPTIWWKGNAAFHHALRTTTSPRHGTEDIIARRRLYVSGSADAHDIRLLTRPWFTCFI